MQEKEYRCGLQTRIAGRFPELALTSSLNNDRGVEVSIPTLAHNIPLLYTYMDSVWNWASGNTVSSLGIKFYAP